MKFIAVTIDANDEDAEAFGPFTSRVLAERFVAEHEEEGVRPAYPLMVGVVPGARGSAASACRARRQPRGGVMRCCGRRDCCADQSLTCNTCADPNANAGCHTCGRTFTFPKHQSAKTDSGGS